MSDDSNQKNRPPRKGGRGGGRDGGGRDGDGRRPGGPPRSDRPAGPRGGFRSGGRTERDGGPGRPARSGGERGAAPREGFRPRDDRAERPAGPRPGFRAEGRPDRAGAGRTRPEREGGERSFRPRSETGERRQGPADRSEARSFKSERPSRDDRPARFERKPDRDGGDRAAPRRRPAPGGQILTPLAAQEPERIAKVMARAGVASRRDSEAMIGEGRVSVNGKVIDSPALDVGPADVILVDNEPLPARERTRLWFYHKPRGLVTTNFDPEGRPTVFDALPEELPRVVSIGRLDINTEGLLLLTNDGGLARLLELPKTGWLRRYRVRAFGSVTQDVLDRLRDGVTIDGVEYGSITARFEREQGSNTWLVVDLREGKNREIKKVLEHIGLVVNRLIRISFGPFQLGDLAEGAVEEVRSRVLKDQLGEDLMAEAGVDFETPAREPVVVRAPAGDDRPRRRGRSDAADAAADGRPLRGDKPWTRTVWRAEDAEPPREKRAAPRRGADPKAERATREETGAVERRREKAVADPRGRRVLVERVKRPAEPEAAREVTPRSPEPVERPARTQRPYGDRPVRSSRPERSERPARGDRPMRAPRAGADERPRRPTGDDRAARAPRPSRDEGHQDRGRPRSGGFGGGGSDDRRFGGKPGGPGRGRPPGGERERGGERPASGPRGFRPGGGKPGGRPTGGKPGGRPGGRPGGGTRPRPGGGRDRG